MKHVDLVLDALTYRRNVGADLTSIRNYVGVREDQERTESDDEAALARLEQEGRVTRVGTSWFLTPEAYKRARGAALAPKWKGEDAWILLSILGIKSWRLPMPKDESLEWSLEFVDFASRKYVAMNVGRLSPRKKALIALRDMDKDTYQFTLKQTAGTGQGNIEINVCSEKEKSDGVCDNSYSIKWFDVPKPFDDGMRFVIADIEPMLGPDRPTKQLILVPIHYRAEDILKEQLPKLREQMRKQ